MRSRDLTSAVLARRPLGAGSFGLVKAASPGIAMNATSPINLTRNASVATTRMASLVHLLSIALLAGGATLHVPLVHAEGGPGDSIGHLDVDRRERTYLVHAPSGYDGKAALPIVIVLHGGGGSGAGAVRLTGMSAKADREKFLAVYPDGTGPLRTRLLTWNSGNCCGNAMNAKVDDVAFIRAMLDRLERDHAIDTKRIFVTGISNGGMMAYRLACEMSDRIAAIAPVAGAQNVECPAGGPVSVIIFHGTKDQNVLLDGGEPRKHFGPLRTDRSVAYAASFWAARNGCTGQRLHQRTASLRTEAYTECKDGTGITVNIVENGGHAWPGGERMSPVLDEPSHEVSATDLMWAFFAIHPKR
ncbi:MAG TPA: PHB depolymerase family esterase [Casimicrobiaceae bacterium]|nr:PHB depolymerase family esterase [Casimicrobiaceae bacterium]